MHKSITENSFKKDCSFTHPCTQLLYLILCVVIYFLSSVLFITCDIQLEYVRLRNEHFSAPCLPIIEQLTTDFDFISSKVARLMTSNVGTVFVYLIIGVVMGCKTANIMRTKNFAKVSLVLQ